MNIIEQNDLGFIVNMQNCNQNGNHCPGGCRGYIHVVEPGDTLYKIAKRYDVKIFDIMRLNPYLNVYNLQIGDEICIPSAPPKDEKTYVVNEGDTLADVLKAFDVSFELLAKYNPILYDVELPEGIILKVPIIQPRSLKSDFYNENSYMNDDAYIEEN